MHFLVGVEATGAGLPVVGADVGGIRDWLKDDKNGYIVAPSSPEQISKKVIKVLTDDEASATRMAQQANESAREFSIEALADNVEKIAYAIKQSTSRG